MKVMKVIDPSLFERLMELLRKECEPAPVNVVEQTVVAEDSAQPINKETAHLQTIELESEPLCDNKDSPQGNITVQNEEEPSDWTSVADFTPNHSGTGKIRKRRVKTTRKRVSRKPRPASKRKIKWGK